MSLSPFNTSADVVAASKLFGARAKSQGWGFTDLVPEQVIDLLAAAGIPSPTPAAIAKCMARHRQMCPEARYGNKVSPARALELIAAALGFDNWNTLKAVLDAGAQGVKAQPLVDFFVMASQHYARPRPVSFEIAGVRDQWLLAATSE